MNKNVVICGSIKPPKGQDSQSAAREIAKLFIRGMEDGGLSEYSYFDLRDMDVPFYDGRSLEEYEDDNLNHFKECLLQAENIIVSVPCYWRSAAGPFVNMINVFGGPLYDDPEKRNILSGKKIQVITVGASNTDAVYGTQHVNHLFTSLGAIVLPDEIMVGNLRGSSEEERKEISKNIYLSGKNLAIEQMGVAVE
ncbi:NADPH-dependent FMN reductase [Pontibacillus marinus]|uniref:NADPH-dependent FMN reductase-like domain-containing protein n=1 Tax=Pontibacillus marinus BH030004 = DSM 16465 TaxID=1385511 RepID=A0A0A5I1F0_9BACI|nr:NAD(P)H-dependent oxidoreductase [Pontibacillus marinus]KGX89687.1 hypothetical protein N783_04710 [Pontibacillus marinus BH030004 = DSM 16465]